MNSYPAGSLRYYNFVILELTKKFKKIIFAFDANFPDVKGYVFGGRGEVIYLAILLRIMPDATSIYSYPYYSTSDVLNETNWLDLHASSIFNGKSGPVQATKFFKKMRS
jgi:hypothetical protein